MFVDENGYERHFHGIGAVVKGPPWHPSVHEYDFQTSLVDEDFVLLQAAGVNLIRLGVMWAGVEPQRGQYNNTYIETLRGITEGAAAFGIYTLLDMHQDAMSEKFCGEGFPAWAVQSAGILSFPEPIGRAFRDMDPATGFPTRQDCARHAWSSYYFAADSAAAWQALYSNSDGLLDAWAAMWGTVVAAFKGDSHILGIEVVNEPFAGNVYREPLLLRPAVAARSNLQRAYDAIASAVWAADPSRLFFFAGVPWADLGSGFPHAPGGETTNDRSVLVFHHYEYPWGPQVRNSSREHTARYVEDAGRLGTALIVTEIAEMCGQSQADWASWNLITRAAENALTSWVSWEYKAFAWGPPFPSPISQANEFGARKTGVGGCLFNANGTVRTGNLRAQARPYLHVVAGKLVRFDFDSMVGSLDKTSRE
jgi:endoglycosylceramidase